MYNNQKFAIVTEANILANDTIGTQVYAYTGVNAEAEASAKVFKLWGYGADPEVGDTRQYFSATMTVYEHGRAILTESKVFDYRQPEPEPEPEE